jgi:hypothetical protein
MKPLLCQHLWFRPSNWVLDLRLYYLLRQPDSNPTEYPYYPHRDTPTHPTQKPHSYGQVADYAKPAGHLQETYLAVVVVGQGPNMLGILADCSSSS